MVTIGLKEVIAAVPTALSLSALVYAHIAHRRALASTQVIVNADMPAAKECHACRATVVRYSTKLNGKVVCANCR